MRIGKKNKTRFVLFYDGNNKKQKVILKWRGKKKQQGGADVCS